MSHQKQKGSSYEREVAKKLSSLGIGEFMRTAHSGAYVGGKNVERKAMMDKRMAQVFNGDVIPPENVDVVIECKNYSPENFKGGLQSLYKGTNKQVEGWLEGLRKDAENDGDVLKHLLFLKLSRIANLVFVSEMFENLVKFLTNNNGVNYLVYHSGDGWIYYVIDSYWVFEDEEIREIFKKDLLSGGGV